jgi:nucleotide-binding universal stress UspA family protein
MPFPYKKILCPVDFDENSVRALKEAAELGLHGDGTLCLLHVLQINPLTAQGVAEGYDAGEFYDTQTEFARKQVGEMLGKLPAALKFEVAIEFGEPGTTILAAAKRLRTDLVVMATHGRRGLRHLVMGSVAERIVRESTVPVLTVRPAGEE